MVVSHAVHAPPPAPHAAVDGVLHVDPEQHPVGHDVESQTQPAEHLCPGPHDGPPLHVHCPEAEQPSAVLPQDEQLVPTGAHADGERLVQVVPEQHPAGHDVASQTHAPLRHLWP
jgi:hypothetical protein